MSAYDLWLEPPDEPNDPPEADDDFADETYLVGDHRSDEREIMLEQRYER
jgi:hypothetical protein